MNWSTKLKSLYPFLGALFLFSVIFTIYFSPLLQDKVISQEDMSSFLGMSNEITTYEKETGEQVMWTNSMFSGMPATTITVHNPGNMIHNCVRWIREIPTPISDSVVGAMGFMVLMSLFGVNYWLAFVGAIAFSFCSYNFQIIQVGHVTKTHAMSLIPWVLSSVIYAYKRNRWLGGALFAFALTVQVSANHPQITYYLAIFLLLYWITLLIKAKRESLLKPFFQTTLILFFASILGIGANTNKLLPTYEYSKYTMRGGSELKEMNPSASSATGGLDFEYATQWSYGILESLNLLVPNLYGGASGGALDKDSETYQFLKQNGAPNADEIVQQLPLYWGPQPFTAGPMYMGAITVFLFVLALFLVKGQLRWWVVSVTIVALLLSWGKHLAWFNMFVYEYLPLYNKFRVPSMILVLLQTIFPLFGMIGLCRIIKGDYPQGEVTKAMKYSIGIVGGVLLLLILMPGIVGNFIGVGDAGFPDWLKQTLPVDRESLLRSDAFRSLFFVIAGAAAVWAVYKKKMTLKIFAVALSVLMLIDLWSVDKRYMNESHFTSKRNFNAVFNLRPVDREILKDKDPHYRVLDLAVNTFNNSHTAYHHKMIGGYSAAKLQRYQDLIDLNIQPEIVALGQALQQGVSVDSATSLLKIVSMLNGKYVIYNGDAAPIINHKALGNAWFVDQVRYVDSPDEEIMSLKVIDPVHTAVINNGMASNLEVPTPDSTDYIRLTSYMPNKLTYKYKTKRNNLALFSEVYYPKGWTAFVDGKEVDILRANYILRGVQLPAGEHMLEFKFEPESYKISRMIAYACSGIIILMILVQFAFLARGKRED